MVHSDSVCGITGKISLKSRGNNAVVKKMLKQLRHRGPDGQGSLSDETVSIAMRRLAIIDLSGGDQPLFNEDNSISVVGNGEIYNYVELQRLLRQKKHKLKTGSDIECAIHLYEEYGLKFIKHMRGIFALALYDKKRHTVLLCRDRFGEKPLYYAVLSDSIIFSSELKSLLASDKINTDIDPVALSEVLHFNFVPEPKTILKSVKKVSAGHFLEINTKTLEITDHEYWSVDDIPWHDRSNITESIHSLFSKATEITARADVPVAIALSGGIDSSSMLATLAQKNKEKYTALSVGYEHQPASDERKQAKELADYFKIPFFDTEISDKDVVLRFPFNVWNVDDPIVELGSHNLNAIYQLAHERGFKVLLSGVGGDELFWGYPWFTDVVKNNLRMFEENRKGFKLVFEGNRAKVKKARAFTVHFFTRTFKDDVSTHNLFSHLDTTGLTSKAKVVRRLQHLLQSRWLASHVNAINDRLSMSNSVELRTPFLDFKLAEFAYGSRIVQRGYQMPNKYWFKKAMEDRLPPRVLHRPKSGFTPPAKRWLYKILHDYIHLLSGGYLVESGYISSAKVALLSRSWWLLPIYWDEMYKMVTMEVWCREYLWGQSPDSLQY